jgi:DNA segregation ATPase FtsK/SpoIIIE-like protein
MTMTNFIRIYGYGAAAVVFVMIMIAAWDFIEGLSFWGGLFVVVSGFAVISANVVKHVLFAVNEIKISNSQRKQIIARDQIETLDRFADVAFKVGAIPHVIEQIKLGLAIPRSFAGETFHKLTMASQKAAQVVSDQLQLPDRDPLPKRINLTDMVDLAQGRSVRKLLLGAGEDGAAIEFDLMALFHILLAGISRWGKSVFIQMITAQIILSGEDTVVCLIDPRMNTFGNFGLPVHHKTEDIIKAFEEARAEMERRQKIFATPNRTYHSLEEYNSFNPGAKLPYWFMICDEMTGLLDEKNKKSYNPEIVSILADLVQLSAKFGMFIILAGQDMRASILPSSISANFLTQGQFKQKTKRAARGLIEDSEAHKIRVKGRYDLHVNELGYTQQAQTPYLSPDEILDLRPLFLKRAKAMYVGQGTGLPEDYYHEDDIIIDQDISDEEAAILDEWDRQPGNYSACYRAYREAMGSPYTGRPNDTKLQQVKDILIKHGRL